VVFPDSCRCFQSWRPFNKIAVARRNPIHPTRMSHMLPLFLCFVFYRETG
jgi:hypothetical protein